MNDVIREAARSFLNEANLSAIRHEGAEFADVLRRWLGENRDRYFSEENGGYSLFLLFMIPVVVDFRGLSLLTVSEVSQENTAVMSRLLDFLDKDARQLFARP